jgi:hypothetical protein
MMKVMWATDEKGLMKCMERGVGGKNLEEWKKLDEQMRVIVKFS